MRNFLFNAKKIRFILIGIFIVAGIIAAVFMLRDNGQDKDTKTPSEPSQIEENSRDNDEEDDDSRLEVFKDDGTVEDSVDVSGDWESSNEITNKQDDTPNKEVQSSNPKQEDDDVSENNNISEGGLPNDKPWGNIF